MKARRRPAAVHIQDQRFPTRALCGRPWELARGGRIASDTTPPVVVDERGSVNPANCVTCLDVYRKRLKARST